MAPNSFFCSGPAAEASRAVGLAESITMKDSIVHFDLTHQSGKPRAYIHCRSPGHIRCYRYRFLHHYSSKEELAQYLVEWKLQGECMGPLLTRDQHVFEFEPIVPR